MNKILPLPTIARLLSESAGISTDEANKFIKAFFDTAAEVLTSGNNLTIKGLGRFELTKDLNSPVKFVIDSTLNKTVNSPFEAFEAIELDAGFDMKELSELEPGATAEEPAKSATEEVPAGTEEQAEDDKSSEPEEGASQEDSDATQVEEHVPEETQPEAPIEQDQPQEIASEEGEAFEEESNEESEGIVEDSSEEEAIEQSETQDLTDVDESTENDTETADYEMESAQNEQEWQEEQDVQEGHTELVAQAEPAQPSCASSKVTIGLAIFFSMAVGFGLGYYLHDYITQYLNRSPSSVEVSQPSTQCDTTSVEPICAQSEMPETVVDTIKAADNEETAPQVDEKTAMAQRLKNEEVYDTVTRRHYLTTLAGKYYGEKDYWVYIYEANSAKLKHPDKIKPGTRVRIPDISSKLTGDKAVDKANAHHKAGEIYSRYK
jgi:nucleoid-associated protein YgaU